MRGQHAESLTTLTDWTPPDARQAALQERYVAHLRAHPDGTSRACRPDHLTASLVLLDQDGDHVLLTLHAKAVRWFQLGGHLEPGDSGLAGAAAREGQEESGVASLVLDPVPVQLDEHVVPFCRPPEGAPADPPGARDVHHLDVRFVAVAPHGAQHAVSEESLDVRWWPVDALPDPEPSLAEAVALARTRVLG
ncbi:MAG: NUDIX hydrolase [Nocardioides sp.]|nr:NUDIX hydrolase [Nocardioides sp.]